MTIEGCVSDPDTTVNDSSICSDSSLDWIDGQEANMRHVSVEREAALKNPIGSDSVVSKDSGRSKLRVYLDKKTDSLTRAANYLVCQDFDDLLTTGR